MVNEGLESFPAIIAVYNCRIDQPISLCSILNWSKTKDTMLRSFALNDIQQILFQSIPKYHNQSGGGSTHWD